MSPTKESISLDSDMKDSTVADQESAPVQGHSLPLFPLRPCSALPRSDATRERKLGVQNSGVKKDVHAKTYTPETPTTAPRYRKNGPADYFPWTCTHPEDVLSESTSKQGFYDRVQVSQNEMSTARPCIWSSLKHKSGLQVLSSLLVSTIDHRQAHRTVTASSTFKPPPRVTLTDTKREAWLRDLADPLIPLRRLSRTIPHGIRGKALLEHCLVKDIPISRAVWLAKCVGANEIRAFKRKGASGAFTVGGEEKWIKDWTTSVQLFVETVMSDCGTSDWRSRMYYCLQLVTYLYAERLLNQEQFLEWLTSSLRNCDLDIILVWLLVAQIYWKEILRYRKHGKRLAEALMIQLSNASQVVNGEALSPISKELTKTIISIMVVSPACLIIPLCWSRHEKTLQCSLEKEGVAMIPVFERLCQRNTQLQKSDVDDLYYTHYAKQQQLIALLDELPTGANLGSIAHACIKKYKDPIAIINTCMCWATSPSGNNSYKIYIVVRLLRMWTKLDVEIEGPLLDFLAIHKHMPPLQKVNVYRILAELVHSKNISVSKYFQRLMAKGSLASCKKNDGWFSPDVQWIFELPIDGLPAHILNLRKILQASAGSSITKENEVLAAAKAEISVKVNGFFPPIPNPKFATSQLHDKGQLSQTLKAALGRWIRDTMASQRLPPKPDSEQQDIATVGNEGRQLILITPEQFNSIRGILESLDEYPILADVIKMCSNSVDIAVLTAASDTVNYHFEIFSAIGAVNDLFKALYDRYEASYSQAVKDRVLTESLIDLDYRLSYSRKEGNHLHSKLLIHEQISILAASPVSDFTSEPLHPSESAFVDEVEKLFTSGTLMENQTLEQVFKKIICRIQHSWYGSVDNPMNNLTDLLTRLRNYGVSLFEKLFCHWLDELIGSTTRPRLQDVLPPFVSAGVVMLYTVLERIMTAYDAGGGEEHMAHLAIEAFELLTMTDAELQPILIHRHYRFHAQQQRILEKFNSLTASILRATIHTCSRESAQTSLESRRIITVIQGLLKARPGQQGLIDFALGEGLSLPSVQQAIDWFIDSSDNAELSGDDLRLRLSKVLLQVTIFNLPLCRLKLRAMLMGQRQSDEVTATILISIFKDGAILQSDMIMNMWTSLLCGLPINVAIQVREKAESELFRSFSEESYWASAAHRKVVQCLIEIINSTANRMVDAGTSVIFTQVTEIFNGILSVPLLSPGSPSQSKTRLHDKIPRMHISLNNLDVLLRLLTIHHSAEALATCPENVLVALLLALSNLLLLPSLSTRAHIADYLFDVLAIMTDSATDEIRSKCIQVLIEKNQAKDPRLHFIFGFCDKIEGEWLQSFSFPSSSSSALASQSGARAEEPPRAPPPTNKSPFHVRKWEMVQEATPLIAENDTSLSLTLFGAREVVF